MNISRHMDSYTRKTRDWLEERFRDRDEKGIYKSHAPIYGFNPEYMFLGLYKNNFAILKEIERMTAYFAISNFLEVGCAEGYTAHLIEEIFKLKACALDLSLEAVKRAREIYHLEGIVADAQALECIKDNSFDLVVCSETLEHLPDPQKALDELLRISKKALIVTVPAAKNRQEKEEFVPPDEPHAHLHIFTKDDLRRKVLGKQIRGVSIKWLNKIESLFTEEDKSKSPRAAKILKVFYYCLRFLFLPLRRLYGVHMAKLFIKLDYWLGMLSIFCPITYLAVYSKTRPEFNKRIKLGNILDFLLNQAKVDYHFLKAQKTRINRGC